MHELTVTQSILDIALESAEQEGGAKIGRISLIIGEMTGVVEECVRFYFRLISRGTAAEDAELAVRLVPITVRCQGCARPSWSGTRGGRARAAGAPIWTSPGGESLLVEEYRGERWK